MIWSSKSRFRIRPNTQIAVQAVLDRQVASGMEIGVQVAAYLDGVCVVDCWSGYSNPDLGIAVDGDTLFNVFSVGKAVVATAVHLQAERGLVDYDAPIAQYWPEFSANGKSKATVRHALTHRLGLPQMPAGVTPEVICDWDLMCRLIADLEPLFPVGQRTAYQSMTFGWILGEIVRRTDSQLRPFDRFVEDEIATPLGARDLWLGVPPAHHNRIAKLFNANANDPPPSEGSLYRAAIPSIVALVPEVFERPHVRSACIAGVGAVFTARSEAKFWAMLAGGGELHGVRLLSENRVRSLGVPRNAADEPDPVMFGIVLPISSGGFWLGTGIPPLCSVQNPRALCHPGAGGSIGWADPDKGLAVAVCHNRMYTPKSCATDPILPISKAIYDGLELN